MAKRDNHYEAAFEEFLRTREIPYVAVDETKRARWAAHRSKVSISSSRRRWALRGWSTSKAATFPPAGRSNIGKTGPRATICAASPPGSACSAPAFKALFVFAYQIVGDRSPLPVEQLFHVTIGSTVLWASRWTIMPASRAPCRRRGIHCPRRRPRFAKPPPRSRNSSAASIRRRKSKIVAFHRPKHGKIIPMTNLLKRLLAAILVRSDRGHDLCCFRPPWHWRARRPPPPAEGHNDGLGYLLVLFCVALSMIILVPQLEPQSRRAPEGTGRRVNRTPSAALLLLSAGTLDDRWPHGQIDQGFESSHRRRPKAPRCGRSIIRRAVSSVG